MQSNSGAAHQACASCKHQRKRCEPNCLMAPFFPHDEMESFQAVHKVFGVSNTQKMIKNIESHDDRSKAIKSIVWEAQCWEMDPVNGCLGRYMELEHEKNMLKEENKKLWNENNLLKTQFLQSQYNAGNGSYDWSNINNGIVIDTENDNNGYITSYADYIQPYPLRTLRKPDQTRNSLALHSQSQINQHQYTVPVNSNKLEQVGLSAMNVNSDATDVKSETIWGTKMINDPNWMR
ncbi:LOB domain-containing protein 2-like [Magnolia sinica]|uniref:LOB domain-containing protein 2-like n=1 Tax=Magnolia sinica TaxID=86752 RepID=UPI00265B4238|nr:LOB domain-containing protein 2-like [Magnolia sinica]